ncbi:DUF3558 domain-containing protein [Amycolatopsis sp. NPDC047767]|uniref:DUF3558 domain-containing protein n=1 Tax=Amycolatopsis sp. NPDC047767 TaxID=3156765 RepID=UPI003456157B
MPHRAIRVVAVGAALSLLTACGAEAAKPTPPQSSSPPSTASSPKVPAPLPTTDLLNDPCNVLNAAETAQIGLAYPGRTVQETLRSCAWTSSGSKQNFVHITALPQNDHGISDIYDMKAQQAYFEPTSIEGYPAVFADTQDGRSSGTCTLWVGVTNQLAASVIPQIGTGRNKTNPCGVAQQVATVMIKHLKAPA